MRRGFTLVELVVVLAILSIVTAVIAPSLFSAVQPTEIEQSANELARLIDRGRARAVEQGATIQLVLDPRQRRYALEHTSPQDGAIAGALPIASSVQLDDVRRRIVIRFDAIGRATPENLVLRSGERLSLVTVDPWSGRASVTQR